jgi:subtilisin family serine protease
LFISKPKAFVLESLKFRKFFFKIGSSRERRIEPMKKRITIWTLLVLLFAAGTIQISSAPDNRTVGINIVLNTEIASSHLAELEIFGKVRDVIYEIRAVTLLAKESSLPAIQALPYVLAANPDAERQGTPVDTVPVADFANGLSTWNLDTINVTDYGFDNRQVAYDGTGVYVAVLDTGLLDSWRRYFPQERIAVEYAKSFGGGGASGNHISEQPNKWEHDQDSHGTHVTSVVLGYNFGGTPINGVAPMANVIPVKVLNQGGWGWSSVIAYGIVYIANLKAGPLAGFPVVINMSLGGPRLDAMEKAAIDYAISQGVIVVAAAGNRGSRGMDYPGAYEPVISVGACGWTGEWTWQGWWYGNVEEPTTANQFYIVDFSGREMSGQDLDVIAPGTWVVGPYQTNSGQISYYYLGGTSQACPHVAGIVALMAQKSPGLSAAQAETILEAAAIYLPPGTMYVLSPSGGVSYYSWDADATGAGIITTDAALAITP